MGVVTGPVPATSTAVGKGVTVMFAGNKLGVQSFVGNLADVKVTYNGSSQTFSNGDRLDHGAEGEVTGPVPDGSPAEGKGMTVLFPGNKLGAQLFVSDLDLTMRSCMEEVD